MLVKCAFSLRTPLSLELSVRLLWLCSMAASSQARSSHRVPNSSQHPWSPSAPGESPHRNWTCLQGVCGLPLHEAVTPRSSCGELLRNPTLNNDRLPSLSTVPKESSLCGATQSRGPGGTPCARLPCPGMSLSTCSPHSKHHVPVTHSPRCTHPLRAPAAPAHCRPLLVPHGRPTRAPAAPTAGLSPFPTDAPQAHRLPGPPQASPGSPWTQHVCIGQALGGRPLRTQTALTARGVPHGQGEKENSVMPPSQLYFSMNTAASGARLPCVSETRHGSHTQWRLCEHTV